MTFNNNCKELKLSDRASSEKNTAGSPHPPCLRGKKFMARLAPEDTCWKTTVIIHARLRRRRISKFLIKQEERLPVPGTKAKVKYHILGRRDSRGHGHRHGLFQEP